MTKKLIIVESPAKAVTLKKYLGRSAKVMATVGHIKNLPKSKLGVDTDNQYQTSFVTIKGKGKVLKEIKSASKQVDEIYLAPDPDREGEAIADHIATELKSDKPLYRVTFNEITKKAVTKALENPGQINKNRVQAQLTRRILDRLVGYKLSPLLWNKVRLGLSAGRVQSVALHVVVKREKEILAFVPTEYWNIEALVKNSDDAYFMTKLMKIDGKAAKIANQAEAEAIFNQISNSPLTISKIEKKERSRHSAPPFITSTLQQEASRRFRFNARTTMSAAQKLYEGMEVGSHGHVGLITYMRTDSTRVSEDALDAVRAQIESDFGSKFLPSQPNFYKNKKSAQDAHEAIRPTDITLTPTKVKPFLGKREFVIYDIIWKRFLASQMASAIFDRTTVDLKSDNKILRATGSIMKFSGFLKVYEESKEEEELPSDSGLDSNMIPPSIKEGDAME
ncbi:MAG: type I DNA topoisomerase, partial [Nitrospinota bacterium]